MGSSVELHETITESLRHQFRTELHNILSAWFPRSVDREHGGFLCDFENRCRPSGLQHKMLEYQARQTIAAARGTPQFSRPDVLREAALNGFRYLKETVADSSGFPRRLSILYPPRWKTTSRLRSAVPLAHTSAE
jgi:mannose/cellobiose epimerase-like protein (N-acyl-D-glucosamine 2-epimerase family)